MILAYTFAKWKAPFSCRDVHVTGLMPRESVYWPLAKPFWRQLSLCYLKS